MEGHAVFVVWSRGLSSELHSTFRGICGEGVCGGCVGCVRCVGAFPHLEIPGWDPEAAVPGRNEGPVRLLRRRRALDHLLASAAAAGCEDVVFVVQENSAEARDAQAFVAARRQKLDRQNQRQHRRSRTNAHAHESSVECQVCVLPTTCHTVCQSVRVCHDTFPSLMEKEFFWLDVHLAPRVDLARLKANFVEFREKRADAVAAVATLCDFKPGSMLQLLEPKLLTIFDASTCQLFNFSEFSNPQITADISCGDNISCAKLPALAELVKNEEWLHRLKAYLPGTLPATLSVRSDLNLTPAYFFAPSIITLLDDNFDVDNFGDLFANALSSPLQTASVALSFQTPLQTFARAQKIQRATPACGTPIRTFRLLYELLRETAKTTAKTTVGSARVSSETARVSSETRAPSHVPKETRASLETRASPSERGEESHEEMEGGWRYDEETGVVAHSSCLIADGARAKMRDCLVYPGVNVGPFAPRFEHCVVLESVGELPPTAPGDADRVVAYHIVRRGTLEAAGRSGLEGSNMLPLGSRNMSRTDVMPGDVRSLAKAIEGDPSTDIEAFVDKLYDQWDDDGAEAEGKGESENEDDVVDGDTKRTDQANEGENEKEKKNEREKEIDEEFEGEIFSMLGTTFGAVNAGDEISPEKTVSDELAENLIFELRALRLDELRSDADVFFALIKFFVRRLVTAPSTSLLPGLKGADALAPPEVQKWLKISRAQKILASFADEKDRERHTHFYDTVRRELETVSHLSPAALVSFFSSFSDFYDHSRFLPEWVCLRQATTKLPAAEVKMIQQFIDWLNSDSDSDSGSDSGSGSGSASD